LAKERHIASKSHDLGGDEFHEHRPKVALGQIAQDGTFSSQLIWGMGKLRQT
jgi:hypothetical protein